MSDNPRIKIILGLLFGLGAVLGSYHFWKAKFGASLAGEIESVAFSSFRLDSDHREDDTHFYRFSRGDEELLVTRHAMAAEAAIKYLTDREYLVDSLYKDYPSPYPGAISHTVRCGEEFQAKMQKLDDDKSSKIIFELYANDRKAYGTCTEQTRKYRSLYLLLHCRNSGLVFDFKYFANPENHELLADRLLQDLHCVK